MNRNVFFTGLLSIVFLFASEGFAADLDQKPIATTGTIIRIDPSAKALLIQASADPRLAAYTVATTSETLFQDGAEFIRFEDFRSGETVSIHGLLQGKTLTASRIAKWDSGTAPKPRCPIKQITTRVTSKLHRS